MNNLYGLSFPIVLEDGSPAKPGLLDSIDSSIRIILAYAINERDFLTEFGTILEALLQAPNASKTNNALRVFVGKAIFRWEGRLDLNNITITQEDEYATMAIDATVKEIKTKYNYKILL